MATLTTQAENQFRTMVSARDYVARLTSEDYAETGYWAVLKPAKGVYQLMTDDAILSGFRAWKHINGL